MAFNEAYGAHDAPEAISDPVPSSLLDGLNESQRRAVIETDGPLLIVAGPGTGKTLTMVRRIARLVRQGARPERMLAVTFTNRAAREMRERAHALLGPEARGMFIGTFHLLGLRIIRAQGSEFTLLDRDEQIALLKGVIGKSAAATAEALERISRIKNLLEEPQEEVRALVAAYQRALERNKALDFDDLIRLPISLFESGAVPALFHDRFSHVIVDEYQDINPAQYRLLKHLVPATGNICVVGDSDQAIYAFRGADVGNFLDFDKDFTGSRTLHLDSTYRSTAAITAAADAVISMNRARIVKEIHPIREQGAPIRSLSVSDEKAEAETIIAEIEARMGGTSRYHHYRGGAAAASPEAACGFSDFAVICRTNAQLRVIEEAFGAAGLPCQVIGRKSARQQQEIEETLAFLKSVARIADDDAGEDVAPENKLLAPADFYDPRAEAVALMTMHMAKGLEFNVVFIAGCEEGLTPYTLHRDDSDIEEERRLFYVAMTRAKDELFLLHARHRFLYGQSRSPLPSPFLADIHNDLVAKTVIPDRVKKQREQDKQLGLF